MPRASLRSISPLFLLAAGACGRIGYEDNADAPPLSIDGTAGDAAPVDAVFGDALSAEICAPDEIVCGNFEGTTGAWVLRGNLGGANTIQVVSSPVILGTGALRLRTDDRQETDGFVVAQRTFAPVDDGTLYGRAYLWVGTRTAIDDFVVTVQLDNGQDDGSQKMSLDLLSTGSVGLTSTTARPAVRPGSAPVLRREDWMCLSFQIEIADRNGSIGVFEGGRPLISLDNIDTSPEPAGFQRMLLAAVNSRIATTDVAYDAVTLSRTPVGCL